MDPVFYQKVGAWLRLVIPSTLLILGVLAIPLFLTAYFELLFPDRQLPIPPAELLVPADHAPKICIGYIPDVDAWGTVGTRNRNGRFSCPRNYAMMSANPNLKRTRSAGAELVQVSGVCCPLPAEDILLDAPKQYATAICPAGTIATGARYTEDVGVCGSMGRILGRKQAYDCFKRITETPTELECSPINTKRYQLGPQSRGLRQAPSAHLRYLLSEDFTSWKQLPPALRYGLSRNERGAWEESICVGYPWGSLLVGKLEKYCRSIIFRQLQFSGAEGDPPAGTPVRMYPECLSIKDFLSPNPGCATLDGVHYPLAATAQTAVPSEGVEREQQD